jgi:hypothetical protein
MRRLVKRAAESYLQATAGVRMHPSFIIVGTQRGGTTSLYRYLASHPGVAPTLVSKGVHYFDVNQERPASWYFGHFPPKAYRTWRQRVRHQRLITGEASPYYLFHPAVPSRVAATLPDVRCIAMLRDPVKRAFSHYHHESEGGYEPLGTFEEALDAEPARLAPEIERLARDPLYVSFGHQHHSYVARGHYADQLRAWFEAVGRDRFLVITSEEMYRDAARTFAAVEDFLELPHHPLASFAAYNAHAYEPMADATRARLDEHFAGPNRDLVDLLGRDPGWGH